MELGYLPQLVALVSVGVGIGSYAPKDCSFLVATSSIERRLA